MVRLPITIGLLLPGSLAPSGHLSGRILDLFRSSEIQFLDLSPSMLDLEGLNLASQSLLDCMRVPHIFVRSMTRDDSLSKTEQFLVRV